MIRRLYQITLVALQAALFVQIVPPLAQALRHGFALGAVTHDGFATIQLASATAAVGGGALALAFPLLALLRHRQRGPLRFDGLPRWSVALAVAGTLIFLVGASLNAAVPLLTPESRMVAVLTARPVQNAGLALMAAGVLCAEVLRRGVRMPDFVTVPRNTPPPRIEVTQPAELATRMA